MRRLRVLLVVLLLMVSLVSLCFAQSDTFKDLKLEVGYIWTTLGGTIYDSGSATTTAVDTLGLGHPSSPWISLERPVYNSRSFLGISYFSLKEDGSTVLTNNIALPDSNTNASVPFAAGSQLNTNFRYSALDIYYKSFMLPYEPESGGLYLMGGLRFNTFKASATDGVSTAEYKVNVPTYYLGIGGDYQLFEGFRTFFSVSGFTGSSSQGKGNLFEYELGISYALSDSAVTRVTYNYKKYNVEDSFGNKADVDFRGFKASFVFKF